MTGLGPGRAPASGRRDEPVGRGQELEAAVIGGLSGRMRQTTYSLIRSNRGSDPRIGPHARDRLSSEVGGEPESGDAVHDQGDSFDYENGARDDERDAAEGLKRLSDLCGISGAWPHASREEVLVGCALVLGCDPFGEV